MDDLRASNDPSVLRARLSWSEKETERLQRELEAAKRLAVRLADDSEKIERECTERAEKAERERDEARAAIREALTVWNDYRVADAPDIQAAYEKLRAALGGEG